VVASQARGLWDFLVGLECREENRPFSGQQHQAQFGLNPALLIGMHITPTMSLHYVVKHKYPKNNIIQSLVVTSSVRPMGQFKKIPLL